MLIVPNWVISNMKKYGNCLIPNKCVEKYGKEKIEDYISAFINSPVSIREIDLYTQDKYRKTYKERGYVADDKCINHHRQSDTYTRAEEERDRKKRDLTPHRK